MLTRKLNRRDLRNNHTKSNHGGGTLNGLVGPGTGQTGGACDSKAEAGPFNHPTQVSEWFKKDNGANKFKFIYGLGVILKYKQETMEAKVKSIIKEIDKNNDEYVKNEMNYEKLMGEAQNRGTSDMKEKLQETVRENLNKAYETKFSELLVKKQSYDVVIDCIKNRRWYLVAELQKDDQGESGIVKKIYDAALEVYGFYRGPKYAGILSELYQMIKTIAEVPSSLQESFALNTSIVGPAGSGKTTMARQIAKWYAFLGIMTYDSFFEDPEKLSFTETGRSGLIGEYTGQTAPKTLGVLVKSLEKTLFIDEAYSVAGCAFDKDDKLEPDAYGEEFLSTMLTFMNDHKGFSAIIVAGYENFMRKCFFDRNEGLPRRFPRSISLPFYATDELFGIFLINVLKKCLDGIREARKAAPGDAAISNKYKLAAYYHFRYLTVMKPSFMMIHGDTSFHAIDILRKYLLSIQLRLQLTSNATGYSSVDNLDKGKGNAVWSGAGAAPPGAAPPGAGAAIKPSGAIRLEDIYSYTIIAQVLINLLPADSESCRKHVFRRLFYGKVFNFEKANMSFFAAQAGEMDNLADECVRAVGSEITNDVSKQVVISTCKEASVINAYCASKKLAVKLYEKVGSDKYYMELHPTNINMAELQKRISEFFEFDKIFANGAKGCVPSLTDLYEMVTSDVRSESLTKHVMSLYFKKIDADYLEDLNALGEKEFPIHMTKVALETEIEALKNINKYKPTKELFEKGEKSIPKNANNIDSQIEKLEAKLKDDEFIKLKKAASEDEVAITEVLIAANKQKADDCKFDDLARLYNPSFTKLFAAAADPAANAIVKSDVLYEDFGYSAKIFKEDEIPVLAATAKPAHSDYAYSLNFLKAFDDKLFKHGDSQITITELTAVTDKRCSTKKAAVEAEANAASAYIALAKGKRQTAKSARLEHIEKEEKARLAVRRAAEEERQRASEATTAASKAEENAKRKREISRAATNAAARAVKAAADKAAVLAASEARGEAARVNVARQSAAVSEAEEGRGATAPHLEDAAAAAAAAAAAPHQHV